MASSMPTSSITLGIRCNYPVYIPLYYHARHLIYDVFSVPCTQDTNYIQSDTVSGLAYYTPSIPKEYPVDLNSVPCRLSPLGPVYRLPGPVTRAGVFDLCDHFPGPLPASASSVSQIFNYKWLIAEMALGDTSPAPS